jgi:hypothetical protein
VPKRRLELRVDPEVAEVAVVLAVAPRWNGSIAFVNSPTDWAAVVVAVVRVVVAVAQGSAARAARPRSRFWCGIRPWKLGFQ